MALSVSSPAAGSGPVPFPDRILRIEPGSILVTVASATSDHETWVARNFTADQVLSLAACLRLLTGSESEPDALDEAHDLLLRALDARARRRLTTVVDGTFAEPERRAGLLEVARRHGRPAVAVCFRVPEELAQFRNLSGRRYVPSRVLRAQVRQVEAFAASHEAEGWTRVVVLDDHDPDLLPVLRYTLPESLPHPGPFDVIGDLHGCLRELDLLLDRLGYGPPDHRHARAHPEGRMAVFVGDFADRGPDSPGVFRRVMAMHRAGSALAVPGNHCVKLLKYLDGRRVQMNQGLDRTAEQFAAAGPEFAAEVREFLRGLPQALPLAGGRLVVFHAALPRERVARRDRVTWEQTTYGVVRGTDETGYPIRDPGWTETWKTGEDEPLAVHGHTPVREPERRCNTLNIDGGCVFGGYLAAFRFPERVLEFVPAAEVYYPSPRVTWRGAPPPPPRAGGG